jgi:hypothetical protein
MKLPGKMPAALTGNTGSLGRRLFALASVGR